MAGVPGLFSFPLNLERFERIRSRCAEVVEHPDTKLENVFSDKLTPDHATGRLTLQLKHDDKLFTMVAKALQPLTAAIPQSQLFDIEEDRTNTFVCQEVDIMIRRAGPGRSQLPHKDLDYDNFLLLPAVTVLIPMATQASTLFWVQDSHDPADFLGHFVKPLFLPGFAYCFDAASMVHAGTVVTHVDVNLAVAIFATLSPVPRDDDTQPGPLIHLTPFNWARGFLQNGPLPPATRCHVCGTCLLAHTLVWDNPGGDHQTPVLKSRYRVYAEDRGESARWVCDLCSSAAE